MKLLMPKQHGAWAMLIIPFALGVTAGNPTWLHLPLFIGWLLLYLASYPLLLAVKGKNIGYYVKWATIYMGLALIALALPILQVKELIAFGVAMIPFLLINSYFSKANQDRALVNDLCAIAAFGIGGLASYFVGTGQLDLTAFWVWSLSVLFFVGSTFYVKTMIREKQNPMYQWLSWGYHIVLVAGCWVAGLPLLALAYAPSAVRAIGLYGRKMSVIKVGVLEIVNSVYFLLILVFFF
ncbi:YwiC-like family protein [Ammoniphilus sp. YIM 78166]|uniref:YwiC-like family protein n=1 Tax=Ammoniphilus sp. YIM 78166 TaxID=1644106 RepID=UPI00106F70E7|nr:YwiC-like family protein [Ammoniphilus sp. YIM 78166]